MLSKLGWKVAATGSSLLAARLTAKAVTGGWKKIKRTDPPANPAAPSTGWGEAIGWATASGVAIALARLAARRGAAGAWRKATGHLPPGLEEAAAA
ncbi:MAG TPA: DUF4235 domain-containing protein [Frankiaceae bacterium]|nr:DUF4235 domain-containing protein [Frankiaceae bacterium]